MFACVEWKIFQLSNFNFYLSINVQKIRSKYASHIIFLLFFYRNTIIYSGKNFLKSHVCEVRIIVQVFNLLEWLWFPSHTYFSIVARYVDCGMGTNVAPPPAAREADSLLCHSTRQNIWPHAHPHILFRIHFLISLYQSEKLLIPSNYDCLLVFYVYLRNVKFIFKNV